MTTTSKYVARIPDVDRSLSLPEFSRGGIANDDWLFLGRGVTESDVKPYFVPFTGRINTVGINTAGVANFDIQLFINGALENFFTHNNVKSSQHLNLSIEVNAGDELSVFCRNAGTPPQDVSVWFTMKS